VKSAKQRPALGQCTGPAPFPADGTRHLVIVPLAPDPPYASQWNEMTAAVRPSFWRAPCPKTIHPIVSSRTKPSSGILVGTRYRFPIIAHFACFVHASFVVAVGLHYIWLPPSESDVHRPVKLQIHHTASTKAPASAPCHLPARRTLRMRRLLLNDVGIDFSSPKYCTLLIGPAANPADLSRLRAVPKLCSS
jgi:hypothetical protein